MLTWNRSVTPSKFVRWTDVDDVWTKANTESSLADFSLELRTDEIIPLVPEVVIDFSNNSVDNVEHIFVGGKGTLVEEYLHGLPAGRYALVVSFAPSNTAGASDYALAWRSNPLQWFRRGETNADWVINISDAMGILFHVFTDRSLNCVDAGDANDDGEADLSDVIHLLSYLFLDGPPPPEPFVRCGIDLTQDRLACESHFCGAR